ALPSLEALLKSPASTGLFVHCAVDVLGPTGRKKESAVAAGFQEYSCMLGSNAAQGVVHQTHTRGAVAKETAHIGWTL
ncbi:unnamed protein product, partial [Rangifer tarandus platyrhynchus]